MVNVTLGAVLALAWAFVVLLALFRLIPSRPRWADSAGFRTLHITGLLIAVSAFIGLDVLTGKGFDHVMAAVVTVLFLTWIPALTRPKLADVFNFDDDE